MIPLVLFLLLQLLSMNAENIASMTLGFVGTGKISSAVARGFCSGPTATPKCIIVSPRNEEKSQRLRDEFPDLVRIASSNEEVVAASDVVFVGLLPQVARSILPTLPFKENQLVISMMAAVDIAEVVTLVRLPASRVVRTVPLPSNAQRVGPILVHPAGNNEAEQLLTIIGKPVVCSTEAEMKPLVSLTGHISSFFELQRQTQQWAESEGVETDTARAYVSSFYTSLATAADTSADTLEELRDEAATPGGLNEQSLRFLTPSAHFPLHIESLGSVLDRLNGKAPK